MYLFIMYINFLLYLVYWNPEPTTELPKSKDVKTTVLYTHLPLS